MEILSSKGAAAITAAFAVATVAACASSTDTTPSSTRSSTAAPAMTGPAMTGPAVAPAPDTSLVGASCADYANRVPTGPGSVAGMAQDPVATAASHNPLLTTLTSAISGKLNPGVNLVDTLNGGEFTVIAPTDEAFAKIDAATISKLKTDAPLLKSILTYHVLPGRLSPAEVAGTHKSVEGADVTVTGTGEALEFDTSRLVCGGVQTANATVYMVDTVLMPPAR